MRSSIIFTTLFLTATSISATNNGQGLDKLVKRAGNGGHHKLGVGHHSNRNGKGQRLAVAQAVGTEQGGTVTITVTAAPTVCSTVEVATASTASITAAPVVVAPPLAAKNPIEGSIADLESSIDAAASAQIISAQNSVKSVAATAVGASASLAAVASGESVLAAVTQSVGGAVSIARASLSSVASAAGVTHI